MMKIIQLIFWQLSIMNKNHKFKEHAIQLVSLQVMKLNIEIHDSSILEAKEFNPGKFAVETGASEFNTDEKLIHVMMRVMIGRHNSENTEDPVSIHVELGGVFEVNTDNFPMEYINEWADRNAPLVIYPYVREHVYGLTSRAGLPPILLPLFEVPTFKVTKSN